MMMTTAPTSQTILFMSERVFRVGSRTGSRSKAIHCILSPDITLPGINVPCASAHKSGDGGGWEDACRRHASMEPTYSAS